MKKTYHILAAAVAAMVSASTVMSAQEPLLGLDLTIVTSNVRYGDGDDDENCWDNRKERLANALLSADADVIGTQEALYYQKKFLSKKLKDYKCVGVAREDGKKDGEHSAVFYNKKRFKAVKCGNFWLSETPDVPSLGWDAACIRIATWAFLEEKATGKRFFIVNTHLDHVGSVARREGVNLLCRKAKEIGGDCPMVITGDFNSGKDSPDIQHVRDMGLKHTYEIAARKDLQPASYQAFREWDTWLDGKNPIPEYMIPAIIDYIFISEGTCSYYKIFPPKGPDGGFLSDHSPVLAKVTL